MKIIFDVTHLMECALGYQIPSGIYNVAYNILKELCQRKNLKIFYYCPVGMQEGIKRLIALDPAFQKGKCLSPEKDGFVAKLSKLIGKIFTRLNVKKLKLEDAKKEKFFIIKKIFQDVVYFILRVILKLLRETDTILQRMIYCKITARYDVFLSPCYAISPTARQIPCKNYHVIIHDIIPLADPRYHSPIKGWLEILLDSIQPTDTFSAVSEYTKRDFLKVLPHLPETNIRTINLAASADFYPQKSANDFQKIQQKYHFPEQKKYFLHLSFMDVRKNVMPMLRAFASLLKQYQYDDLIFVLAGKQGPNILKENSDELGKLGLIPDKILALGFVPGEDLATLYSNALSFVFLSSYEGFGLPVLEAMQCGCPVICSDSTSLPEVAGDAALCVPWDNKEAVVDAMHSVYADHAFSENLRQKGLNRAKLFSWEKTVDALLENMC